jgi:hypothetical protein
MTQNLHRDNAAEIAMRWALRPVHLLLFVFIRVHSWTK